jgi:hypothetical protein
LRCRHENKGPFLVVYFIGVVALTAMQLAATPRPVPIVRSKRHFLPVKDDNFPASSNDGTAADAVTKITICVEPSKSRTDVVVTDILKSW